MGMKRSGNEMSKEQIVQWMRQPRNKTSKICFVLGTEMP